MEAAGEILHQRRPKMASLGNKLEGVWEAGRELCGYRALEHDWQCGE